MSEKLTPPSYAHGMTPIGTIISSYLDWTAFKRTVNIAAWDDSKEWAPCDGRVVDHSQYKTLSGKLNAPDLRGLFLRSLNVIDPDNKTPIQPGHANPDEPAFGTMQQQSVGSHVHALHGGGYFLADNNNNGPIANTFANPGSGVLKYQQFTSDPTTGQETRPNNLSVYYYIKINY